MSAQHQPGCAAEDSLLDDKNLRVANILLDLDGGREAALSKPDRPKRGYRRVLICSLSRVSL